MILLKKYKFKRIGSSLFYILLFLFCFLVILYKAQYGADTYHESVILKPSLDVAKGKILFLDTFTHYGQMNTYFDAFWIYLFGPTLYSVRIGISFAYSISLCLLFFLSHKLFDLKTAILCSISYFFLLPFIFGYNSFLSWSTVYCIPLQLLLCILILFLDRKNILPFSIGFGFVLTLLLHTRQPMGAISTILFLFAICFLIGKGIILNRGTQIKFNIKLLAYSILGFILTNLLIIFQMVYNNSLEQFYLQNIHWALFGGATHPITAMTAFSNLFPMFIHSSFFFLFLFLLQFIYKLNRFLFGLIYVSSFYFIEKFYSIQVQNLLPYIVIYLSVQYLIKGNFRFLKVGQSKGLLLLALASASWINFHPNTNHILTSFLPFLFFIPFFLNQNHGYSIPKFLLFLFIVYLIIFQSNNGRHYSEKNELVQFDDKPYSGGVLKGIYLWKTTSSSLKNLEKSFEEARIIRGDEKNPPILNTTNNPYISLLTENPWNYDPANFFWIGLPFKLWDKSDVNDLEKVNPIVITGEDVHSPAMESKIKILGYQCVSTTNVDLIYTSTKVVKFWVIPLNSNINRK
jgi:hypothetical protein